jgi:hypothetical protein
MKILCLLITLLFTLFYLPPAGANVQSETFIVRSFDRHVEVLAPSKLHDDQVVVIENKTLDALVGRLQTADGRHRRNITVKAGGSERVSIPGRGQEHLIFIPLAPAFQEVELRVGRASYEIPQKR